MQPKYLFVSALMVAAFAETTFAQQIPTLNQYVYNRYLYNPAVAGIEADPQLYLSHKRQWDNIPEAPVTTTATFDMGIDKTRVGVGAQLFNDRSHLITNTGGAITYAYHLPLNADRTMLLSMGLSAGVIAQRFDFARATVEEQNDNTLLRNDAQSTAFTANIGANFRWKGLNIGLAVPQVANSNAKYIDHVGSDIKYQFERHFLGSVSYKLGNPEKITVEPTIMVRGVTGLPMQFDATVLANYKQAFWAGIGYRSANVFSRTAGMNGTVGFALAKRISLAYTVEGLLDSKDAGSFGLSHEVLIGYRFGDSRKTEEELKRIKERLDGHDQQIMASGKRIDSLGKTHDDRLANLESKTAAHDQQLNNNKTAIDKTNSDLNAQGGRLTNAEKDIKDLREKGSNNSNSTNIQKSGSDIAYRKMGAVFFKVNSSELTAESKSQLDALKAALASKKGNFMIYIAGNASTEGSANDNLLLSLRRSAAVKGYLEKAGIIQPVLILANGEEVPETAKQTTDPERKQNRRVDIFISGE